MYYRDIARSRLDMLGENRLNRSSRLEIIKFGCGILRVTPLSGVIVRLADSHSFVIVIMCITFIF